MIDVETTQINVNVNFLDFGKLEIKLYNYSEPTTPEPNGDSGYGFPINSLIYPSVFYKEDISISV